MTSDILAKDFYNYIYQYDLIKQRKSTLIIPERGHFFYDTDELKKIKIIIDCRELNNLHNLRNFVDILSKITQKEVIFYGRFQNIVYDKNLNLISKITNYLRHSLNNHFKFQILSKKEVIELFRKYGFKIYYTKKISGITYFYAKKI